MKLIMVAEVPDDCAPAKLLEAITTAGDAFNEIGAEPNFDTNEEGKKLPLWRVLMALLNEMIEEEDHPHDPGAT